MVKDILEFISIFENGDRVEVRGFVTLFFTSSATTFGEELKQAIQ